MKLQLLQGFGLAGVVTTVLVAQPVFAQVLQVTGVQLNSTDGGIEVILTNPNAASLEILTKTERNTYIADIKNAQLHLASGNTFRQNNPVAGISSVTVTNQDANSIRVTVTGSLAVPTVELFDSDEGLIFSFIPAISSTQAQQSPPKPERQTLFSLAARGGSRRRGNRGMKRQQRLKKLNWGTRHSKMKHRLRRMSRLK